MNKRNPEEEKDAGAGGKKNKKRQAFEFVRIYALASTIGFQIAVPIVVGILGGRFLDRKFGTEPWLLIICLFLGLAASIAGLVKIIQNIFGEGK